MTTILREKVFRWFLKQGLGLERVLKEKKSLIARMEGEQVYIPYTNDSDIYSGLADSIAMVSITQHAKTVLFRADQAQVFTSVHETYFDSLDYKLPFDKVFLQFDRPVVLEYQKRSADDIDRGKLIAIALDQTEVTEAEMEADQGKVYENYKNLNINFSPKFYDFQYDEQGRAVVNKILFLYEDWGFEKVSWQSKCTDESLEDFEPARASIVARWKNVAIACIGYINCENVHLERIQQVPEAINAKRERKGKSRLEPYYICRIRGVQYDSTDPTGTGTKHGIRYDVRGHFRRLQTGKTTWVRPHQRGLTNELYVPKTYLVDRRAV